MWWFFKLLTYRKKENIIVISEFMYENNKFITSYKYIGYEKKA